MMNFNPYGNMSHGTLGLMNGVGMPMRQQPMPAQGPINPMQAAPEAGMMGGAPAPESGGSFFDPSSIADMAAQLRGVKNEGAQMQGQLEQSPNAFAGPMPDGGNLYDAKMQRAKMMQNSPFLGGLAQNFMPV